MYKFIIPKEHLALHKMTMTKFPQIYLCATIIHTTLNEQQLQAENIKNNHY